MRILFAVVLVSCVDVMSIVACFTVIFRVCKLPRNNRCRLFPRQVVVLALADLFYSFARLPWNWFLVFSTYMADGKHAPYLVLYMNYWSYHTTLLAEFSIMIGFAMQSWKCSGCLRALARLVWAPFVLAAGFALLSVVLRDPDQPWCLMQAMAALGSFSAALLAIGAILCRPADRTTRAVLYRGWNRAMAFVVNFLITMAPETALVLARPGLYEGPVNAYRLATTLCMHSNGLMNALTYLYQSRYAQGGADCVGTTASLEVHFGGVHVEDLTPSLQRSELTANASLATGEAPPPSTGEAPLLSTEEAPPLDSQDSSHAGD